MTTVCPPKGIPLDFPGLQIQQSTAPPAPVICPFLHWVIYPLASGGLQLSVVKPRELLHNACVFSTGGIEKAQEGDHICEQQDGCLSIISRKALLPQSHSSWNPLPSSNQTVTRECLKILANIYWTLTIRRVPAKPFTESCLNSCSQQPRKGDCRMSSNIQMKMSRHRGKRTHRRSQLRRGRARFDVQARVVGS